MSEHESKSRAERGEEIAGGRTGKRCPFCGAERAAITTRRDRRGILAAEWDCEHCDESGFVLDGRLFYVADGVAS